MLEEGSVKKWKYTVWKYEQVCKLSNNTKSWQAQQQELTWTGVLLTNVSIGGSSVSAEGGHAAGAPGALLSKQTRMISGVEERLKKRIQRVGRSAQRALRQVRAGGAVTGRRAVRRGSAAGGRQRSHSRVHARLFSKTGFLLSLLRASVEKIQKKLPKALNLSLSIPGSLLWLFIKPGVGATAFFL